MSDLYRDLGVPKDSSPEEIKKAYRKKAKEVHPDKKGGNENEFKKISRAYALLSDGEKRKQYDQGADPDKIDYNSNNLHSEAVKVLSGLFVGIINSVDVDHNDVFTIMKQQIRNSQQQIEQQKVSLEIQIRRFESSRKRIKRGKNDNSGLFLAIIDEQINQRRKQISELTNTKNVGDEAKKMLDDCEYEVDPMTGSVTFSSSAITFL